MEFGPCYGNPKEYLNLRLRKVANWHHAAVQNGHATDESWPEDYTELLFGLSEVWFPVDSDPSGYGEELDYDDNPDSALIDRAESEVFGE